MEKNEKESYVVLNKDSWHYRLIKWAFDIDGDDFNNLCPYFWLTVAAIFVSPFMVIIKFFSSIKNKLVSKLDLKREEEAEKWLKQPDAFLKFSLALNAYDISMWDFDGFKSDFIPDKIYGDIYGYYRNHFKEQYDKEGIGTYRDVSKYIESHKDEVLKLIKDNNPFKDSTDALYYAKYYGWGDELKSVNESKNKAIKIANTAKNVFDGIFGILLVALFWFVTMPFIMVINLTAKSFIEYPMDSLTASLIIIAIAIGLFIVSLWICAVKELYPVFSTNVRNRLFSETTVLDWVINILPFIVVLIFKDGIYKGILKPIGRGIVFFFGEFGEVFVKYFNASYSDYCPGIEWKEKNDKNNNEEE